MTWENSLKSSDAKVKWPKVFRGKLLMSLIEPKLSVRRLSIIHIHNIWGIFWSAAFFCTRESPLVDAVLEEATIKLFCQIGSTLISDKSKEND